MTLRLLTAFLLIVTCGTCILSSEANAQNSPPPPPPVPKNSTPPPASKSITPTAPPKFTKPAPAISAPPAKTTIAPPAQAGTAPSAPPKAASTTPFNPGAPTATVSSMPKPANSPAVTAKPIVAPMGTISQPPATAGSNAAFSATLWNGSSVSFKNTGGSTWVKQDSSGNVSDTLTETNRAKNMVRLKSGTGREVVLANGAAFESSDGNSARFAMLSKGTWQGATKQQLNKWSGKIGAKQVTFQRNAGNSWNLLIDGQVRTKLDQTSNEDHGLWLVRSNPKIIYQVYDGFCVAFDTSPGGSQSASMAGNFVPSTQSQQVTPAAGGASAAFK